MLKTLNTIDFDAYAKYSKPGPRYTSYPTALEFSEKFTYDEYLNELKKQDKNRPLSLYFHLPFRLGTDGGSLCNQSRDNDRGTDDSWLSAAPVTYFTSATNQIKPEKYATYRPEYRLYG